MRRAGHVIRLATIALGLLLSAACAKSSSSAPGASAARATGGDASSPTPECSAAVIPPGDYGHAITKAEAPNGQELIVGYWVAMASDVPDANCFFPLYFTEYDHKGGKVLFSEEHPYTVEGKQIVLHGNGEPNAHYRVVIQGNTLTWIGGSDDGETRRDVLQASPWIKIS